MQAGRTYFSSSCELSDVCLGSTVLQCSASRKVRVSIKCIGTSMFLFLSHTSTLLARGLLHGQTKEAGEKTSSEGPALLPQSLLLLCPFIIEPTFLLQELEESSVPHTGSPCEERASLIALSVKEHQDKARTGQHSGLA